MFRNGAFDNSVYLDPDYEEERPNPSNRQKGSDIEEYLARFMEPVTCDINQLATLTYDQLDKIVERRAKRLTLLHEILNEYHHSTLCFGYCSNRQRGAEIEGSLKIVRKTINWLTDYQLPTLFKHPHLGVSAIRDLFFLTIMDNQSELADFLWHKLERDQIPTALMASSILKFSSKKLRVNRETFNLPHELLDNAQVYENRAMQILQECYKSDPDDTHLLLIREMNGWDHRTILSLAFAGQHMGFPGSRHLPTQTQPSLARRNATLHTEMENGGWHVHAVLYPLLQHHVQTRG